MLVGSSQVTNAEAAILQSEGECKFRTAGGKGGGIGATALSYPPPQLLLLMTHHEETQLNALP